MRSKPALRQALVFATAWTLATGTAACGSAGAGPRSGSAASPRAPSHRVGGAASTGAPASSASKLQSVKVQLAFLVQAWADPYILAQESGDYRQVGLDAHIVQGGGSAVAAQVVANGKAPFGVIEAGTAATLISKGLPIKVVAVFLRETPEAFIHDPSLVLNSPRDLIGHPVISSAGGAQLQILPAVLGRYGMSKRQLHFDLVNPRAEVQAFLHTKGSVLVGPTTGNYAAVLNVDPSAVATPFTRFGVRMYNSCVITSLSEIRRHPGTVRRFLAASVKGWAATVKDPAAAADAAVRAFPRANRSIQLAGLRAALKLLYSPATQGRPLGWMSAADWRSTLTLLHRYGGMNPVKPLTDYYTNRFLPAS